MSEISLGFRQFSSFGVAIMCSSAAVYDSVQQCFRAVYYQKRVFGSVRQCSAVRQCVVKRGALCSSVAVYGSAAVRQSVVV